MDGLAGPAGGGFVAGVPGWRYVAGTADAEGARMDWVGPAVFVAIALVAVYKVIVALGDMRQREAGQRAVREASATDNLPPPRIPPPAAANRPTPHAGLGLRLADGGMKLIGILYRDADGQDTARPITIRGLFGNTGEMPGYSFPNYIVAFCHLRREERTFRVSNIDAIVTPDGRVTTKAFDWLSTEYKLRPASDALPDWRPLADAPTLLLTRRGEKTTIAYDFTPEVVALDAGRITTIQGQSIRRRKDGGAGQSARSRLTPTDPSLTFSHPDTGEIIEDIAGLLLPLIAARPLPDDPRLRDLLRLLQATR